MILINIAWISSMSNFDVFLSLIDNRRSTNGKIKYRNSNNFWNIVNNIIHMIKRRIFNNDRSYIWK